GGSCRSVARATSEEGFTGGLLPPPRRLPGDLRQFLRQQQLGRLAVGEQRAVQGCEPLHEALEPWPSPAFELRPEVLAVAPEHALGLEHVGNLAAAAELGRKLGDLRGAALERQ